MGSRMEPLDFFGSHRLYDSLSTEAQRLCRSYVSLYLKEYYGHDEGEARDLYSELEQDVAALSSEEQSKVLTYANWYRENQDVQRRVYAELRAQEASRLKAA